MGNRKLIKSKKLVSDETKYRKKLKHKKRKIYSEVGRQWTPEEKQAGLGQMVGLAQISKAKRYIEKNGARYELIEIFDVEEHAYDTAREYHNYSSEHDAIVVPFKTGFTWGVYVSKGVGPFNSYLPNGYTSEYKGKNLSFEPSRRDRFDYIRVRAKDGSYIDIHLYEHEDYIELEGLFTEVRYKGHGTKVLEAIKRYADDYNKGIMVRDVSNERWFNRFDWLQKVDDPLSEYGANPNYVYKVSGKIAEPFEDIEKMEEF